jgi:superfamily II DNA/RNA helicase
MNDIGQNTQDAVDHDCGFQELGLDPTLIAALHRLSLDAPTEIQRHLIPAVLEGRDCLARARTGAGKTNSYLLPILQSVAPGEGVQALVIQPTRSIALQLERNLQRFAPERPLRTAVASGGRQARNRPDPLAEAPDVLIATPRGAAELVKSGRADWAALRILVIDEADAILEDRGPGQLREVHAGLPDGRQTVLLAGDLDEQVRALADELLRDPFEATTDSGPPRASSAAHCYFLVSPQEKFDALVSFCKQQSPRLAIVVANSEKQGRDLARRLERARVSCRWIGARRAARGREQRDRRHQRSRSEVIVAADPTPRRLSTIPASHLVHYELPADADGYMQRLQQAARLRKRGTVIAFVEPGQDPLLDEIQQRLGKPLKKLDTPQRPPRRQRAAEPSPAQPGKQTNPPEPNSDTRGRLTETLRRDEELESRGVRPIPRTLGSRFRSTRRGKPLRRPSPGK